MLYRRSGTLFDDFINRNHVAAPRDPDGDNREHPTPLEPTLAEPGSPQKLRVMKERHAAGYGLHHPLDLRADYEKASTACRLLASEVAVGPRLRPRQDARCARWNDDEDEVA
jgi:hypothetical protein